MDLASKYIIPLHPVGAPFVRFILCVQNARVDIRAVIAFTAMKIGMHVLKTLFRKTFINVTLLKLVAG